MYLIFLFIILILFLLFNFLLTKYKETFDSTNGSTSTVCSIARGDIFNGLNFSSLSSKNSNVSGEDGCANENQECLVDVKGNNTCCGDLKCVRLKNNYGHKVCSYQDDACGYFKNDYLKYIFDDDLWNSIYDKLKALFYKEYMVEEEDGDILKTKRREILNKIQLTDICGKKYSADDIRKKLDEFFTKDEIFSGLIYGVKKVAEKEDEDKNEDKRDCKYSNRTVDNY